MTKKLQEVLFLSELGTKLGVKKDKIKDFSEVTNDVVLKNCLLKEFEWVVFKEKVGFTFIALFELLNESFRRKSLVCMKTDTPDIEKNFMSIISKNSDDTIGGNFDTYILTEGYTKLVSGGEDGSTDKKDDNKIILN